MRVFIACSLDGFIAGLGHDLSWLPGPDESGEDYGYHDFLAHTAAILMGRAYRSSFAEWPYGEIPKKICGTRPRSTRSARRFTRSPDAAGCSEPSGPTPAVPCTRRRCADQVVPRERSDRRAHGDDRRGDPGRGCPSVRRNEAATRLDARRGHSVPERARSAPVHPIGALRLTASTHPSQTRSRSRRNRCRADQSAIGASVRPSRYANVPSPLHRGRRRPA